MINKDNNSKPNDEIDFRKHLDILWKGKWIIIVGTFFFALSSVLYAISLPNIYKSSVTLAKASSDNNALGLSGQLGGLASLAGLSLGSGSDTNKTGLALAVLRSKQFKMQFIENRDILPQLMASVDWDMKNDELIYDADIYDFERGLWTREVSPPKQPKPSLQEAVTEFSEILNVNEDKVTGMVTISVEHYSPYVAKQWVDWITHDLNENMRAREKEEAIKSIAYLEEQLEKTQLADIKEVLFELIEEQTKTLMFTEVRDEYVFKTIDPAIVAEEKSKPSRALICILGTFLGGFLSVFFVFMREFSVKLKRINKY